MTQITTTCLSLKCSLFSCSGFVWRVTNYHNLVIIFPYLATIAPDLPEAFQHFIQTSCRRNPADRYQRVADATADLKQLAKELRLDTRDPLAKKFTWPAF